MTHGSSRSRSIHIRNVGKIVLISPTLSPLEKIQLVSQLFKHVEKMPKHISEKFWRKALAITAKSMGLTLTSLSGSKRKTASSSGRGSCAARKADGNYTK